MDQTPLFTLRREESLAEMIDLLPRDGINSLHYEQPKAENTLEAAVDIKHALGSLRTKIMAIPHKRSAKPSSSVYADTQVETSLTVELPLDTKGRIKTSAKAVELYTEFPTLATESQVKILPYWRFILHRDGNDLQTALGSYIRYGNWRLNFLGEHFGNKLIGKVNVEFNKEVAGGNLTFGAIENVDLYNRINLKSRTHLSFVRGRLGVALQTKRKQPLFGPPEATYLHLWTKFTKTKIGLRAKFKTYFSKFTIPEIRVLVHSQLGNNFFTKNEYNFPLGGNNNYFGYAYSDRLNFGVMVKQIKDGEEDGFLGRPFNFGVAVNYQD